MHESTLEALMYRLDRLVWENRCWRVAAIVTLIGFAAVGLMGQAQPTRRTVEAQGFILRDANGKLRAWLSLGADGGPALVLLDRDGKRRAGLNLGADGTPAVVLLDKNEKLRIGLNAEAEGTAALTLLDTAGKRRVVLAVQADGTPRLALLDEEEKAL